MKKTLLVAIISAPLLLTGCVVAVGNDDGYAVSENTHERAYENRENIARLHRKMRISDVQNLMGVADFNENYQKDDGNIQVLFYRTHRVHKDGLTTKDECTPLVFKNGILQAWGDTAYQQM